MAMRQLFDQLAKRMLTRLLGIAGKAETEFEVSTDAQKVDIWFVPYESPVSSAADLGWLGHMAREASLFEPFHNTPSLDRVLGCVRKQLNLWHVLELGNEAKRSSARLPRMWIISPGEPETVIDELQLSPPAGWPVGFFGSSRGYNFCVVVLRLLPKERNTLLLRLMGTGDVFREAVQELMQLPSDAVERKLVVPILVRMRIELMQVSGERDDEEKEFLMNVGEQAVEEYLAKVREEGREEGREKGREEGVEEGCKRVARNLLVGGFSLDKVASLSGLSLEAVRNLSH